MLEQLIDTYGENGVLFAIGLFIGLLFGAAAQHSRVCMRSAAIEVAQRKLGKSTGIWFTAFATAMASVQLLIVVDLLDVSASHHLASIGSISGVIVGGLIFGAGMILSRGCASRLVVLSATGNLRAIVTGLLLVLIAAITISGILSPLRETIGALWPVQGGDPRNLLAIFNMSHEVALAIGAIILGAAIWFAIRQNCQPSRIVAAMFVGLSITAGWIGTYMVAQTSFEVVPLVSISFTSTSVETLRGVQLERWFPLVFGTGVVPGVMIGSFVMSLLAKEFEIQRFEPETPMERYLVGGIFMGFGGVLASGCSVGAGMSGTSIFALTAFLALIAMWVGAIVTHLLITPAHRAQAKPRVA